MIISKMKTNILACKIVNHLNAIISAKHQTKMSRNNLLGFVFLFVGGGGGGGLTIPFLLNKNK